MYWFYCILAFLSGTLAPLQAGINSALRGYLNSPYYATLVSVIISTISMMLVSLVGRMPLPEVSAMRQAPWWVWLGGIVGVLYVFAVLELAPRLGATVLVASIIGGQMACSLVLDHFGIAGFSHHSISAGRIVGAIFLLVGVILIQRS